MPKEQFYILYLIIDRDKNLLKIGKTRRSHSENRYKQIVSDFKVKTMKHSMYCESIEEKDIDNLERILHKAFYEHRLENRYKKGIGKTEWFNLLILDEVIQQINFFRKNNKTYSRLTPLSKGIEVKGYGENGFFNFIKITFGVLILVGAIMIYEFPTYMNKTVFPKVENKIKTTFNKLSKKES
jgi:hypothetical protein